MLQLILTTKELERMQGVLEYRLLDTLPQSDYYNITKLVSSICEIPIALITILDILMAFCCITKQMKCYWQKEKM